MTEQDLLLDCVRRLNKNGVVYMVTGSMASNVWGIPRSTHDLDLVLQLPPSQISSFSKAFTDSDYYIDEQAIRAAFQSPFQFNVLHIPSALKIDFWILRPDSFEREMFGRRMQILWRSQKMWIATAEDVLLHKLYWNRITPSDRQLSDAAGIVAVQKDNLDASYLNKWAVELGLLAELNELLSGKILPKRT